MKPSDFLGVWPVLLAVLTGSIPIFGLVVWYMRRGPQAEIDTLKRDVDGIGKKVDERDRAAEVDRRDINELRVEMGRSVQDRQRLRESQVKTEATVDSLEKQIVGQQRDIMEAIRASSLAQLEAVHEAKIEIARLGERANMVEAFTEVGDRLERTIKLVLERDADSRRR